MRRVWQSGEREGLLSFVNIDLVEKRDLTCGPATATKTGSTPASSCRITRRAGSSVATKWVEDRSRRFPHQLLLRRQRHGPRGDTHPYRYVGGRERDDLR